MSCASSNRMRLYVTRHRRADNAGGLVLQRHIEEGDRERFHGQDYSVSVRARFGPVEQRDERAGVVRASTINRSSVAETTWMKPARRDMSVTVSLPM